MFVFVLWLLFGKELFIFPLQVDNDDYVQRVLKSDSKGSSSKRDRDHSSDKRKRVGVQEQ